MRRHRTSCLAAVLVTTVALLALPSCKREERGFRVQPPSAQTADYPMSTAFHVGPSTQPLHVSNAYEQNAYALNQGKIFYENFNCVGCHFHGGGGIGPPLMDDKWVYGFEPDQIFATIIQGRPNGMPSFKGKIPDYQVWQIVAYVRSMSGLANSQAAGGRDDHMKTTQPPASTPPASPVQSYQPPSTKAPL